MSGEQAGPAEVTGRNRLRAGGHERCVRLASDEDREAVGELRRVAYENATQFALHDRVSLAWSALDGMSAVLTAWQGNDLVSTLRATTAEDAAAAEDILTCTVDLPVGAFPAMVLTKGATRPGRGAAGLHSVLRYHCLLAARGRGVHAVLGLVYADAPRVRTMGELGYEFRQPARVWDPEGVALTQPLFAVLGGDRIGHAVRVLATAFEDTLARYPWTGPALTLPTPEAAQ